MGKEIKITCDSCHKDIFGGEYITLKPTKIVHGRQTKFCTIWMCRDCFNKTKLQTLLFNSIGNESEG